MFLKGAERGCVGARISFNFTENIGGGLQRKQKLKPLSLQIWSSPIVVDVRIEKPTSFFLQLEVKNRGGNYQSEHT